MVLCGYKECNKLYQYCDTVNDYCVNKTSTTQETITEGTTSIVVDEDVKVQSNGEENGPLQPVPNKYSLYIGAGIIVLLIIIAAGIFIYWYLKKRRNPQSPRNRDEEQVSHI